VKWILGERGVTDFYLSTWQVLGLWSALGFRETGEIDRYNNRRISGKSIIGARSSS
jgi:hypothetical protein